MTEQPVYTPARKRNRGLWIAAAVAVVGVTIGVVFGTVKQPPVVADESLEAGLLTSADYGSGFTTEKVTQSDLDLMSVNPVSADATVNPPECAEFLSAARAQQEDEGGQSIAMMRAANSAGGLVYVQAIMRADQVALDLRQAQDLVARCAQMTITAGAATRTLHVSEVTGVEGDGYASMVATGSGEEIGAFSMAFATTKVGEHVVTLIGISFAGVLDETDFVQVVNAANERVRTEL
jgi:hypothetical protein